MELDDFKSAWQSLDARLALQNRLQLELLHERRFDRARRNLRPLLFGMGLQAALGLFLVLLGIACWKQNLDAPGLFASGIALHAFGVLHIALAGLVGGLALSLDYAAPVLAIQKRLRLLLRLQVFNSNACGAPWWVMWGWWCSASPDCRRRAQADRPRPGSGSAWRWAWRERSPPGSGRRAARASRRGCMRGWTTARTGSAAA